MGLELATFPALPAHVQTVTLDGVQFRLRLTWRRRCQAWYLDLWTLAGTALALGRRLSPGWMPLLGLVLEDGPDGYLLVRGEDGYTRDQLGEDVQLVYYSRAEMQAAQAAAAADTSAPLVEV
jgi:hypothetical protein